MSVPARDRTVDIAYRMEYTLRMNCIRIGNVASATEPPNFGVLADQPHVNSLLEG